MTKAVLYGATGHIVAFALFALALSSPQPWTTLLSIMAGGCGTVGVITATARAWSTGFEDAKRAGACRR